MTRSASFAPFAIVEGARDRGLVLVADHARRELPEEYGDLGLPASEFDRHIAYDIGVEDVTRRLAATLGVPAVIACYSRLLIDCNRALTATDFRSELPKVDVPTLVVHGDRDVSAPLALTGSRAAALIPGTQTKIYEGAPHGLMLTHIDRLNQDLLDFVGACRQTGFASGCEDSQPRS